MPELTLLRPWWLLALPLVALAWWWLARRGRGAGDWGRVIEPGMMAALAALGRVEGARAGLPGREALIVAVLAVVALAGPAVERRGTVAFRNLDGVVFVVDASPSATGDRWAQTMTMGRAGVAALGSRPAALVLYAGDAYVASDMTSDTRQLGQTLAVVEAGTVPDRGSRPERGLALAREILDDGAVIAGDVVLLTDGGGVEQGAFSQAQAIAARGARLSVVSDADLSDLAQTGNGHAFALSDAEGLARFLREDARTDLVREAYPLLFRADLGRWAVLLALVPALLLFRRVGA